MVVLLLIRTENVYYNLILPLTAYTAMAATKELLLLVSMEMYVHRNLSILIKYLPRISTNYMYRWRRSFLHDITPKYL